MGTHKLQGKRKPKNYKRKFQSVKKQIIILSLFAALLFSCKSVKTTTNDQSSYNSKDSIRTVIIERVDSFIARDTLIIRDTTYLEQEKNTSIQFGEGGGTYNAITGEATNIVSLNLNETLTQLQITNRIQASTIIDLAKENAILQNKVSSVDEKKDIQTSVKETSNSWQTWLIVGLILGAILMFALIYTLKKLPLTQWLVAWI